MNILWEELTAGLTDHDHLLRVLIRLFAAILLGAFIGRQRVSPGKPSGLRTHILVCLGTTAILLSCSIEAISPDGVSRVIQGIVTGIGFLGAGSILKTSEDHLVHGLTVSARLWTTAAVGIEIGLGEIGIALITAILASFVVAFASILERGTGRRSRKTDTFST
jgi:putative Mg2+ transporter-C (MgtC) family protein